MSNREVQDVLGQSSRLTGSAIDRIDSGIKKFRLQVPRSQRKQIRKACKSSKESFSSIAGLLADRVQQELRAEGYEYVEVKYSWCALNITCA